MPIAIMVNTTKTMRYNQSFMKTKMSETKNAKAIKLATNKLSLGG